ncbi:MAG: beta strand repeat-containing protein, partial [Polyangia bacterium]
GNATAITTTVKVDTTAPSAPSTFGFASLTNAFFPGSGSIVYIQGGSAGGFTTTASGATDTDTGITGYTYGAIAGTGWSNTGGAYTFTAASTTGTSSVTATNGAGTTGSGSSFTAQSDSTDPTGGAFSANGTAASGPGSSSYLSSGTTLTIDSRTNYAETQTATESGLASSTLTIKTATLTGDTCGSYGAPTTITGTTSQTVASGNCYLLTLTGTDNVGNATTLTTTVKVDTIAPSAPSSFSFGSLTNAYFPGSGSIVYIQGGSSGGFTTTASGATDTDTGIATYTYPALGSGWSNVNGTYTFNSSAGTQSGSATATNGAGLTGSGSSFTAQSDTTPPAGGAVSVNGTAASGAGTSSYLSSGTTLTIDSRTNYTETQTATASGLASSVLTIESATLTANTCGSYGAPTTISGTTSQTVASGNCYRFTLTGTDNVGNSDTITTVVKVDTTAPSAPAAFSFSGLSASAYWPGSGSVVYFQTGASGSFTVAASGATDADTGVASYSYPSLGGAGWSNINDAYTYTSAATTQSGSITATNNSGLTGSGTSFTAQGDAGAPTGGDFSANGTAAGAGGSTSYITGGTTLTIDSRTNFSETQDATHSGLDSSTLTIKSATLSGNTCGSYGAPAIITGTTSQTVASGNCYLLTLTGTDNVGNTDSVTTTVKVDTTAPTAPSAFTFSSLTQTYYPGTGSTVFFNSGGTGGFTVAASGSIDADTGITGYSYSALGSGWSHTGGVYTFNGSAGTQTGSATATNGAGTSSSGTDFTAEADSSAPTSSIQCNTAAC